MTGLESDILISVIVPTYDEKDNIHALFDRTFNSLKHLNYEIIVVDDDSPDGTAQKVQELSQNYPVKLIVKKNDKGLAASIVEGFKHATGDIFVVMDADLQHPPEKIMSLVEEIHRGADIAVGSRYNQENGFGEFSPLRKIISKGANVLATVLLRELPDIKDIQSGFFALKRDVIKDVELKPAGYKILLEILAMGKYKTVKETGYIFSKREYGESKLGAGTMIDYIRHLISISWRKGELMRFLKYCIIGATGIVVNTAILFFFTGILGVYYLLSSAAAYEVSIITNFVLNDRWTFRELVTPESSGYLRRAAYYNGTMVLGAVFGIVLLWVFTDFFSFNYIISNLVSITIVTIWRYYTSITAVWVGEVKNV